MADKEQKGERQDKKPKGKKKAILALILVLVLLGGAAGAGYFFLTQKSDATQKKTGEEKAEKEQEEVEEDASIPPVVMALDIFTANLQPADSEKYLQIGVALKFAVKKEGESVDGVKPYIPDIRNAVLTKMAELKPEDVTGNAAREKLRETIKAAIRDVLPKAEKKKFKDVLFTQFVVQ